MGSVSHTAEREGPTVEVLALQSTDLCGSHICCTTTVLLQLFYIRNPCETIQVFFNFVYATFCSVINTLLGKRSRRATVRPPRSDLI